MLSLYGAAALISAYLTPWRQYPADVRIVTGWKSFDLIYKVERAKLMYNIYYEATPPSMGNVIQKRNLKHNLGNNNKIVVPRFNTYVMKNSIGYRGANMLLPSEG